MDRVVPKLLLLSFVVAACGGTVGAPDETGDTSQAMTANDIMARANDYLTHNIVYCGGALGEEDGTKCGEGICHPPAGPWDGYRSDCSGFVSYCWQIPSDPDSDAYMQDESGSLGWKTIAIDELQPGDAVVTSGHIKLWGGFSGSDAALIYEEYNCNTLPHKEVQPFSRSGNSLWFDGDDREYHPIRRNNLAPPPPPGPSVAMGHGQPVGRNADGRLELFAVATNGQMIHRWQTGSDGAWSPWASLGGDFISEPTVVTKKDGNLELFAVNKNGALYHRWQDGTGWNTTGWESLGGAFSSAPSVAKNVDGREELFAVGTNREVYHRWQIVPGGAWVGAWESLGGTVKYAPAVIANKNGALEVFAVGMDNAVYSKWQAAPGERFTASWFRKGGAAAGSPSVARNKDGRLELFVVGTNKSLWHTWQESPGGAWSAWSDLGGALSSNDLSVAANADGHLEVFALGGERAVWHTWQVPTERRWSGWSSLKGSAASAPAVQNNADGRLEAFVVGTNGAAYHAWQLGDGWSAGWFELGSDLFAL